jgi:hypothetical protein
MHASGWLDLLSSALPRMLRFASQPHVELHQGIRAAPQLETNETSDTRDAHYVFICTGFIGASLTFNWKTSGRL